MIEKLNVHLDFGDAVDDSMPWMSSIVLSRVSFGGLTI